MSTNSGWGPRLQQRLTRRRALAATGAGAVGAAFLAACGGSGGAGGGKVDVKANGLLTAPVDTSKQAVRGGTIKDARTVDISNFDPHNTQSGGSPAGTVNYYHQTGSLFSSGIFCSILDTQHKISDEAAYKALQDSTLIILGGFDFNDFIVQRVLNARDGFGYHRFRSAARIR